MPLPLTASYAACRALTKERAKNFYYGIRLLPEERRDALCAVYAFFRICDDLSDEDGEVDQAGRLTRWRLLLQNSPNHASEHDILPAFYHAVERFQIPHRYFEELLDGTLSDLTVNRYPTFEQTYRYCYQVASTVGLVCLHVFGFDGSPEALEQAEARGIAFQLTNILRDVAEDAQRGRIYLPLDELERFGLREQDILSCSPGPGWEAFLAFQVARARTYYDASAPLASRVDRESRASLEAMTTIYRTLLDKIERLGARVFQERARLTALEKMSLASKTLAAGLRQS